jgi:SpoVK/Ycf46/Vps4 family AAA+-type ATPase
MIDWIRKVFDSPDSPVDPLDPEMRLMLRESLRECEALYRAGAKLSASECPRRISGDTRKFVRLMIDLHRGLVIKILIEIGQCDRQWHAAEREVAKIVMRHAWGVDVTDASLAQALRNVADQAETLKWDALVEPFTELPPLIEQIPELTVLALRIANLVAKADGHIKPSEAAALRKIERELEAALDARRNEDQRGARPRKGRVNIERGGLVKSSQVVAVEEQTKDPKRSSEPSDEERTVSPEERQRKFEQAMKELDRLVGLEPVKRDIREMVDFIKIQAHRMRHKLATVQVSLHTVFEGNPGTGKTTVARILGRIFCGLGLLDKGHTVETDRSGLVAQYAGQTGPRTHERVDEALHGVLFIDEAYSLIAEQGQDAFGVEAVQALLKRMEDDRDQLIVVLAGYPRPMRQLLRSNPGLSSRFQRTFAFPDYSAMELLKIFHRMCRKSHYRLTSAAKRKLHASFQYRIDRKDEHFGNGRLARNEFERTIRRQASRLVGIAPMTRELLTTLEAIDVEIPGVPASLDATVRSPTRPVSKPASK